MQVAVYLSLGQTNFTSNVWSITAANAVIFGEALHVWTSLTGRHARSAMQLCDPSKFSAVGDKVFTAASRHISTTRPMSMCGLTDHFCCTYLRTYDRPIVEQGGALFTTSKCVYDQTGTCVKTFIIQSWLVRG